MKEIAEYLNNAGQSLVGCSEQEIEYLENVKKIKLPNEYKYFLLTMGKSAGNFMRGSSCFWDEIFDLEEGAIELLKENNFKELPQDVFVFFMHQGYQFAFFKLTEGDNPPVYYYGEGHPQSDFVRFANSITDFFRMHLKLL
jgi:SMI1 / KNR4 family (SUKH-1)